MLKKYLSKFYYKYLYNSAFGQRLRIKFGDQQIAELKPFSKNAVISDLFILRSGGGWSTSFQLFNISSFLFPEMQPSEECEIHVFDQSGSSLKKLYIHLDPFELKTINFDFIENLENNLGSFAVFHFSEVIKRVSEKGSRLTERGYVAYRYNNQGVYNFCHGNLQALAKNQRSNINNVVGLSRTNIAYYPQMIFSDCEKFELAYTNPSNLEQEIVIELFDKNQNLLETKKYTIDPFGVETFSFQNPDKSIHTIKNQGKIIMWRPVIFKHYETYFDVLHG